MLGFSIAFCIISLVIFCILSAMREWGPICFAPLLLFTFTILIPFEPSLTVLWVWWLAIAISIAPMIWYGKRGREALGKFLSEDVVGCVEKFQKWNQ